MTTTSRIRDDDPSIDTDETPYAWLRLAASTALATIGGVGFWSFVVALPAVQADFGAARADASLPFTALMIGFALGGVWLGRLSDRFNVLLPLMGGTLALSLGYILAGFTANIWQLALVHGVLIGVGTSANFAPLIADVSQWFTRRRGMAVAICSAGNYVAGTIWPPLVRYFIDTFGWRGTHIGIGIFCAVTMLPLAMVLRRRTRYQTANVVTLFSNTPQQIGLTPGTLQLLLSLAGVACCVAMAMPQVHIVAYCGDLGYGVARGAEMLALMLGFGIVSRVASGLVADRIGGVRTLLLSSTLQGLALVLYLMFDGLASLYVISALFGLFQGGIVPCYAIIIREYFSPREAGARLGIVVMATLFGMAGGGWLSGAIFDATGSYQAAFLNGIGWNLINITIVGWLLLRQGRRVAAAA